MTAVFWLFNCAEVGRGEGNPGLAMPRGFVAVARLPRLLLNRSRMSWARSVAFMAKPDRFQCN
jgi:hypothetical protein